MPGRSDHLVPGDPPVPVQVHRPPPSTGPLRCLYSMHGGGYVIGSYDIDSFMLDDLCPRLGIVGVTVDYRLAPETPYPGPLDDCYRGLQWTVDHADDVPSTAAAARATDLAGLPPAFVSVGALDGFLDEDVDFALRLTRAGVPCELHVYPGAPHGYHVALDAPVTTQSRRDVEDWMLRQVRRRC